MTDERVKKRKAQDSTETCAPPPTKKNKVGFRSSVSVIPILKPLKPGSHKPGSHKQERKNKTLVTTTGGSSSSSSSSSSASLAQSELKTPKAGAGRLYAVTYWTMGSPSSSTGPELEFPTMCVTFEAAHQACIDRMRKAVDDFLRCEFSADGADDLRKFLPDLLVHWSFIKDGVPVLKDTTPDSLVKAWFESYCACSDNPDLDYRLAGVEITTTIA
jgi:hypothetical protein